MFFDKLREIVEARRCGWSVSLLRLCSKLALYYLPMARVRNRNPTIKPRYPTKGRIHMAATEELGLPLEGSIAFNYGARRRAQNEDVFGQAVIITLFVLESCFVE